MSNILSKKQLGFALPIAILIVVVLIIAGGAGYYFYKTSVEKAEPLVAEKKIEEEEEILEETEAPAEEEIPQKEIAPEEIKKVPEIKEEPEEEPAKTTPYCGNNICETGETYLICPQDCPTTAKDILDPAFKALVQKIGEDDAIAVANLFTRRGLVLTEEFVDEFIIDYYPGYDADEDITIIGGPEAPYFLEIAKASLDRLRNNSLEIYQYSIEALRHIRGTNFGTRCGAATTDDPAGMAVNTYNYIYDYKDVPLDEQLLDEELLVYGFLFVHEATHLKINELRWSGQIRELTGIENETIAYLAHGYYAKEYDPAGQTILAPPPYPDISIKEFVKTWVTKDLQEFPEDYVWDWDFYINVLEKAGFPSEDLDKMRSYLSSAD